MSKVEEIKNFIKEKFGLDEAQPDKVVVEKQAFVDASLEDGTPVQIEPSIQEGAAVISVVEGEEPKAVADGVYTLVSGEVITTVDGSITLIEEVVSEEEVPLSEEPTETQEQKIKKVVESTIKESHFAKVESIEELRIELTATFKKELIEAKEEIASILMLSFDKFDAKPIEEPTKKDKYSFTKSKAKKNNFHS